MNSCCQWMSVVAAVSLLALGGCANKGATTLDEDANEAETGESGGGARGNGDSQCGNGAIDEGEECDGADLNGVTCMNLGFDSGRLFCDPVVCTFATDGCRRPPVDPMGGAGG